MISALTPGTELRRFKRSKLSRIAIAAIVLIPLLYSTLYLWAFWNPFDKVNQLPIAFVNADRGAVVNGTPLNAGDKIVDNLKNNDRVSFHFTEHDDAVQGVRDGRYYFAVELTPDFSEAVVSPANGDARRAVIQTTYNDSNGYLSTKIGENVMSTMLPVISDQIGTQAIDRVLIGMQTAGGGIEQAADGAGRLHDGATKLNDGLNTAWQGVDTLASGSAKVDEKMGELAAGADRLAAGTQQLNDGVTTATASLEQLTQGVDKLHGGVDELAGGATRINDGVQQLTGQLGQVTQAQTATSGEIRNLANSIPDPGVAAQLNDLAARIDAQGLGQNAPATAQLQQLANGTGQLAYQLSDPNAPFRSGFDHLHAGTGQLPGKLGEMQSGVRELNTGTHTLASGAHQLHDEGTTPLASGAARLNGGMGQLRDGSSQLATGSGELATKLNDGAKAVPTWTDKQREGTASVLGGPVSLTSSNDAGSNTFGGGLSPFFLSLSLFIGGIATFMLLRPMQNRAVASGIAPLRAALDGLAPALFIAALQALVVCVATMLLVGLSPAYPLGLIGFAILVAIMFAAINQLLNVALGPGPGRVAGMAFLMLQLLSCGGLYPVETEPRLFQILHPIMPMTYSVDGFRQLIYGTLDHRLPQAIVAVLLITAVTVGLTALCARRDRTWTMKRLHPAIKL